MCGIFAVAGNQDAAQIVTAALRKMAYRGYDSAGVLTLNLGAFNRNRAAGKIDNLEFMNQSEPLEGQTAIGHTRWATHGAAIESNAHPHICGRCAVVHNGIIENHTHLRKYALTQGYAAKSQTDSEVIALLLEIERADGKSPLEALRKVMPKLEGAYAVSVVFTDAPELIYIAKQGSPLAVGLGAGENYVGSDALSIAPHTQQICYLEDGDVGIVSPTTVSIFDARGHRIERNIHTIDSADSMSEKDGHAHFMAKEMYEQPQAVWRTISHHVDASTGDFCGPLSRIDFSETSRILLIACGTSFYACLTAKYWIEDMAGIPVEVDVASEAQYRNYHLSSKDTVILVSQSGETADTLAALKHVKSMGARIVSLVNTTESSIARESDEVLPLKAGPEIGVASTKAFTCQLALLAMLAIKAGRDTNQLDKETGDRKIQSLTTLPQALLDTLALSDALIPIARALSPASSAFFIGRGSSYPIAMEGALKLKEISYIHSEGFAAGELKHGPIALIEQSSPTLALHVSGSEQQDKTLSSVQEIAARGGPVYLLSDRFVNDASITKAVILPKVDDIIAPFVQAVAVQIISYHTALILGRDIDQPRNLAKAVTVS